MTMDAMIRDLNSNLQVSSCDDSIESVHKDSRCMRSLRPQVNLCLKIKILCERKIQISYHNPLSLYVWEQFTSTKLLQKLARKTN